ncbi:uncharacterized protein RCC_05340 [Ramularia collo-cygni]|uniref:DUF202 domain-containing protein n=1 Tax=Ramularia collo-cygni TaxID=112498 RepID=A0A2D3VCW5_9PEZI|nr:uncharacterized protein RCC_05340 [Ramularia collo-cygni]CZT19489.1 uncharacterized protein RCC_05340 [Ramularia collo-cygni]
MQRRRPSQPSGDSTAIPEPEPAHLANGHGSDDDHEVTEMRDNALPSTRSSRSDNKTRSPLRKWWRENVRLSVPSVDCRDHYANERTFLGYLRTSVALSMLGVLVAQLYRLQHSATPDPTFGYFALGKPLSAILQCAALGTVLLGGIRFWRQQSAMARGKVYACGFEMLIIMGFVGLLLLTLFVLHIALDISK